ncbi:MAG: dTMP kinase [Sphingobium sp.]
MAPGRFITLEGGEGAGKSTQLRALAARLRQGGLEVVETREPGGSAGAEAIRQLLLTGAADRWGPRAEALLFAAARSDHVERTIRPALARGAWVLSDRFLDSSRAYQGMGALCDADILALHKIGSDDFLPDRTLLLALSQSAAQDRVRSRDGDESDRIGGRDTSFHGAVNDAFARFAGQEPARFRVVNACGDKDAVTDRLHAAIADLLP